MPKSFIVRGIIITHVELSIEAESASDAIRKWERLSWSSEIPQSRFYLNAETKITKQVIPLNAFEKGDVE